MSAAKVVVGFHLREVRGVVSSNILSTCSRVRPLVSGTKTITNVSSELRISDQGRGLTVCEKEGQNAEAAPHEEDVGAELGGVVLVGDKVGCDDGDDAVPKPVGGGGETDTAGADGKGEDLADDDPGSGAPGGSEGRDVQADEGNHSPGSVGVGGVIRSIAAGGSTDDTNDKLHDDHETGTPDKNGTATNLLNHDEGEGSAQHIDEGGDHGDKERVVDGAELLEEDGTEVEDEVDTGELLEHLDQDTNRGSADVGRRAGDLSLEARHPRSEIAGLRNDRHLVLVVSDDFSELVLDELRVHGLAADAGKSVGSLVELALLNVVTRRLGQQRETDSENESPEELNGDRDAIRSAVAAFLGGVDDAASK